jgi:hypothetical protein
VLFPQRRCRRCRYHFILRHHGGVQHATGATTSDPAPPAASAGGNSLARNIAVSAAAVHRLKHQLAVGAHQVRRLRRVLGLHAHDVEAVRGVVMVHDQLIALRDGRVAAQALLKDRLRVRDRVDERVVGRAQAQVRQLGQVADLEDDLRALLDGQVVHAPRGQVCNAVLLARELEHAAVRLLADGLVLELKNERLPALQLRLQVAHVAAVHDALVRLFE